MSSASTGSAARRLQWKGKYGGLDVSEARRLQVLADENAKLKKLLAEAILDNAMLKYLNSKMVMPVARRQAVAQLCSILRLALAGV